MTVGSLVGVVGTVCFDFLPISTSFRLAAKGKAAVSSSEVRQILAQLLPGESLTRMGR